MDRKCIVFSNNDVTYRKKKDNDVVKGGSVSKIHLLVIPWKPVYNCVALDDDDIPLLDHMRKIGLMVGKELAKKYTNKGPNAASKREYSYTRIIDAFKKGKQDYLKRLEEKSDGTNKRLERILRLQEKLTRENTNIRKSNFHLFTQFSSDEKRGKFAQMKKFTEKYKIGGKTAAN
jgi:hypothetical protein